jgi:hypothetical protein
MRSLFAAAVIALGGLSAVSAQESVTLLLKSGERLPAQLMDLSASGFTVQVGNEQRNISKNDIAVIDFGGSAAGQPKESENLGGRHLFLMRNGSTVRGELVDIGGSRPLRLTVRTDSGNQDLSSADVRRIYLDRPPARPGADPQAPPPPAAGGVTIRVNANQQWTPTNISVRRGQQVRFQASGEIRLATNGEPHGPGGSPNQDKGATIPTTNTATLIGRIGPAGQRVGATNTFVIGSQNAATMPADGMLYLGVNDSVYGDNSGWFTVVVNAGQAPAAESVRRR